MRITIMFKRGRGKTPSGFSQQETDLMKAMVLAGIRKIEIVEQPAPALQHPTDVLLRIVRAGICGSDLHYYTQGRIGDQIVQFPLLHWS